MLSSLRAIADAVLAPMAKSAAKPAAKPAAMPAATQSTSTTAPTAVATTPAATGKTASPQPTTRSAAVSASAMSIDTGHTLVVVFQRFAADWINMLVPYGDPDYAVLRPNLRIAAPLTLDHFYGLHPALAPLKDLYDRGRLGFVTATGWMPLDSRDRSHFFAQSLAEAGAREGVYGGWLGRTMQRDPVGRDNVWSALAAEASVPASLQGYPDAVAVRDFADYNHGSTMGGAATELIETLARLAGEPGDTVRRLAESMRALSLTPPPAPSVGVSYPATTLGNGLKVAAQAIRSGMGPRVVTVTSDDDWDTHVSQASRHNASLPRFAGALKAFHDDLGSMMDDVTLVTMTEFGRKARENLGGTDHGTASSMLVMGGGVAGGRVYGQWPGLAPDRLFQGEDLEPTTDYRAVLGEILCGRLGVSATALDGIFPGGYAGPQNWRGFLR